MRRAISVTVGLVLSAICLWLLGRQVALDRLRTAIAQAHWLPLAAALATKALSLYCMAARSRALYGRFGRWPIGDFVSAHLVGFGGNVLLPFRLGELLRVRRLARQTSVAMSSCAGMAVVERLLDLLWLALFVLCFPALFALDASRQSALVWTAVVLTLGLIAAPVLTRIGGPARRLLGRLVPRRSGRLTAWVSRAAAAFLEGVASVHSAARFLEASAWTVGYWLCSAGSVSLWFLAFDLALPWHAAPLVIVFLAFGVALPAAPGFLGTYHVAVVAALRLMDVPIDQAVAVAIVGHAVATLPAALVSLPWVVKELRFQRQASSSQIRYA